GHEAVIVVDAVGVMDELVPDGVVAGHVGAEQRVGTYLALVILLVDAQLQLEVRADVPQQGSAVASDVLTTVGAEFAAAGAVAQQVRQGAGLGRIGAGEVDAVLVAGTALGHAGYAGVEVVGQCEVVAGAHIHAVELTGRDLDVAGVVTGRLLAHQANGAAEGATAEQGTLRATQHFHALEVHQVHHRTHGGRVV